MRVQSGSYVTPSRTSQALQASQASQGSKTPARNKKRQALRIFMTISRILPVILQAVLLVMAIHTKSWMMVIMSATSMAMSLTTALQALISFHPTEKGGRSPTPTYSPTPTHQSALADSLHTRGSLTPEIASRTRIQPLSLAHMLGAHNAGCDMWRLTVRTWFAYRANVSTLCAQIGRTSDHHLLQLDLVHDGPHALVAGTTGSGKSVFLESWCSALALTYPPSRLNFVFLDFKGGATFTHLCHLPHAVGSVSDLSLALARRALLGLERELRRREQLLAHYAQARLDQLDNPPPRLVIVIDEFNVLRQALPDYLPRLARLASQGRSLGMHLILATQSPSAEVPRTIQANIGTNVCLRVRDALQSSDLVGTRAAAFLSSSQPGLAVVEAGEGPVIVRAPLPASTTIAVADLATAFFSRVTEAQTDNSTNHGAENVTYTQPHQLFTPPLPSRCHLSQCIPGGDPSDQSRHQSHADAENESTLKSPSESTSESPFAPMTIGLADDGVMTYPAILDPAEGNIAVCEPIGRGKTTLCQLLHRLNPHLVIADDADHLLDPLCDLPQARNLQQALTDPACRCVYCVRDPRLIRFPSHCAIRVFFPTGDKSADMLAGIPSTALSTWEHEDLSCPGRALLADSHGWRTIQIADG